MADSPTQFKQVVNHGFDEKGYECRERGAAVVECDRCGKEVLLIDETEEWVKGEDGRWHHASYGPAQGVCCRLLYVDSFEGCFAYRLERLA